MTFCPMWKIYSRWTGIL